MQLDSDVPHVITDQSTAARREWNLSMAKGGSTAVAGVPAGSAHNQRERETRSQEERKIKMTYFRCHARRAWSLAQGQQMPQKTSKCQVPTLNGKKKKSN